jgi:phosphatidylserine decarboxylase
LRIIPDGIYYACGLTLVGLALSYYLNPWVGVPLYVLAAFCLYFFRDPERIPPPGDVLVSPADGKVVSIRDMGDGQSRLSIFLNIFDVHVNRAPIPGTITNIEYRRGKFGVASHETASSDNEQNTLVVEGGGRRVVCRQIAGLIARRIVCYKRAGDYVAKGERIGYIKFGSRVDVFFGPEWKPAIKIGDKVAGGTTILANSAVQPES